MTTQEQSDISEIKITQAVILERIENIKEDNRKRGPCHYETVKKRLDWHQNLIYWTLFGVFGLFLGGISKFYFSK